jgi:diguanylate cyclase (GGDEF)-like protein
MRHPAAVTGPSPYAPAPGTGTRAAPLPSAFERRIAPLSLAALLAVGALMGSLNLFVDGVLRDGGARWAYTGTMLLLFVLAAVLARARRIRQPHILGLVLLGDVIYLVVVLCIQDPLRYATPLMLLFPALAAAWLLQIRALCVHMVLITGVCLVALWPSYDNGLGLAVQLVVSSCTLNAAALGVFLLRLRLQRLLTTTTSLSRLDPLTGLHNRRHLVEQAPRLWRQARREGTHLSAMVLDLDQFKRLNDEFGHAVGDAVLEAVARSLSASVRPGDVLVRTGGEELVVLGSVAALSEARALADRLRVAVAETHSDGGHAVTVSIGLAIARPVDGEDPVTALWRLVDRADAAMYAAKRGGRDRVSVADLPTPRVPASEETTPA